MKNFTYVCLAILLCVPLQSFYAFSKVEIPTPVSEVQRVRIDITTPLGFTRHLLLGFTSNGAASDGVDYGYDAQNADNYANDSSWMIENNRYVIQGVGAFNPNKAYPLGLFLEDAGTVEFSLLSLENFDEAIDVYVYDSQNSSVTPINDNNLSKTMSTGNYVNRFYITFTNDINLMTFADNQLSTTEFQQPKTEINYISSTKEININTAQASQIESVTLYSLLGQSVKQWSNLKTDANGMLTVLIPHVTNGTYLLSVKTKTERTNKRLIISH